MKKLHLLRIEKIEHINAQGDVIWEKEDLLNVLHTEGEQYMLEAAFVGGSISNEFIPENFWFGLDDRAIIDTEDTLASLDSEPSVNGYARQAVTSTDGFSVALSSGYNKATAPIVTFAASGGSWGPVSNLFMATTEGNSGLLIATVALGTEVTVPSGDSINVRMSISLN
tara:strand:+ start:1189 stop:1695 length:507 start_codon:yes stop_codon:yes gene_type:complete